ncbi:hypothetical protein ACW185_02340 [Limosilactobacillus fermentum]
MAKLSVIPSAIVQLVATDLSLQVETVAPEALPKTGKTVGLDVGIADLAISSDGEKFGTFNAKWLEKQATKVAKQV